MPRIGREVPSGVPDGWFDLDAEGLIDAVRNLDRRNLREIDQYLVRSRINAFRESELISKGMAQELLLKLDSLAPRPRGG